MNARIFDLNKYRNKRSHSWLRENESRISDVVRFYLHNNFRVDLDFLSKAYQSQRREGFYESWDYLDFREVLSEILERSNILDMVLTELKSKHWFEEKQISRQKLLEICLSIFVLDTGISA